jgi:hypothetical protein
MERKWHHPHRPASPARLVGKRAGALGKQALLFVNKKKQKNFFNLGMGR